MEKLERRISDRRMLKLLRKWLKVGVMEEGQVRTARVKDIREVIRQLNPVLRGWGGYFRTGNASAKFNAIDSYVRMRLCRVMAKRGGQRKAKPGGKPFTSRHWTHQRFVDDHGLYKLLGTIRYPGGAHAG